MFVSLHVHSDHSLHDGFQTVEDIVKFCKENGQSTVALTDHGTMSGCGEGFRFGKKYGIKFIAGCEHYLVNDVTIKDKISQHIVLLAMNKTGYRNLNILTTEAHSENNYYFKQRIDLDLLRKYNEGIICTTACIAGCQNKIAELKEIFGDRLYIEIHTNQMEKQKKANVAWLKLAEQYDVPYYAAVDAHYTKKEDGYFQRKWTGYLYEDDPNIVFEDGKWVDQTGKEVHPYEVEDDYYMHTEEEVRQALSYLPSSVVEKAIQNTNVVAERCTFEINFGENHYPKSNYASPKDEIRMRTWRGMKEKGLSQNQEHINQVRHELDVLQKVNYFDYFVIVDDMLNYCRTNGIRTGVGRGSVVGCDVAYLMGITKIDPIQNGLIFERFAHTERVTPPDIDTDIQRSRRQDVIRYLKDTYGHVFQVVTFGKMQEKGGIRRACDSFHIPAKAKDKFSSAGIDGMDIIDFPFVPKEFDNFVETCKRFQGKIQNYGTHASAVVVTTDDPYDFCAIERFSGSKGAQYNLNYDFHDLESMGLLKLDILGLETLDIIETVLNKIPKDQIPDMDNLPQDNWTYSVLNKGNKCGVFQLDGGAVGKITVAMQPNSLADLTAIVALGRPGPLRSGMTNQYIDNRKNKDKLVLKDEVAKSLEETYGTVIYQEQVMKVCQIVWGMSLGEADMIRRAIGRKDKKLMDELVQQLSERENKVGYNKEQIRVLLDNLEEWSGYLFNKSHAAAYAYTAYQTAFLKAHFPMEFYCSLLNSNVDQEKSIEYLAEVKKNFSVLPPNILKSDYEWTYEGYQLITGLSYVRGVGNSRFTKPFSDGNDGFKEFIKDNPDLSKTAIVGLVKARCFTVDPLWALDYVDAYRKVEKRQKECREKILHYRNLGKAKNAEEWTKKLRALPPLPEPENYDTPLETIREMQRDSLGFSEVNVFSGYDKSLVRGNNRMVFVDEIYSFNDRNGNLMFRMSGQDVNGEVQCLFWKPLDKVKERLDTVQEKSMWIVRTGKLNKDGKSYFCYDLIPAKKLA